MRFVFYRLAIWMRDTHRTGYVRPILVTVAITAVVMAIYKFLEHWLFPRFSLLESRVTGIVLSSALAGLMAYVALRLYRQMAQETIEELTERLRLSEELLEERNLIKSLMENTVDRIYFKDLDGRFIRASSSVAIGFGLKTPSELAGRSDFDFFAESYARETRQDEQAVVRNGQPIIGRDYREVWADGRETWASVSIVPLRDRHGHVIGTLGIARDITAVRQQAQRVRQLSRAVEQSPSLVVITDRSGAIEYVNPTFTRVTGYDAEEVRGRNPRLLNSGRHPGDVFKALWETVLAGHEWRGELLNRRKDGSLFWARTAVSPIRDAEGHIDHLVSVSEDITQEKEAMAALQAEQARRQELERIINISPTIVFLWKAAPGWPVELVSDNVRLWGCTPEDLTTGQVAYSSLVHPDDLARVAEEVQRYTQEGRSEFTQEYRIMDRAGVVRWIEDRTWVRRDAQGVVTHYQGVVLDITERRRAEAAQQESERQLAEAQRIARLGNWEFDVATRQLRWSQETFRIAGLEPGRAAPTLDTYLATLHAADRPVLEQAVERAVAEGVPFEVELRHRCPDGSWNCAQVKGQPIAENGRVVRLFGTALDITERAHAEEARQALTEGLRAVLQLADELIACPSEDALYLRAVELAREHLGLERCGIMVQDGDVVRGTYGTNLRGETTAEHQHRVPLDATWQDRLRVRGPRDQRWVVAEEPYRVWDGATVVEQGRGWIGITPIQSSRQGAIGVFCNDTAISGAPPDPIRQDVLAVYCSLLGNMVARKRAEEEQRAAQYQQREFMERTDRLNSLGLLAAGMAHEINNPLQGMLSHLHAVQRALPEPFPARKSLDMVERGIDTIATLVRKLLFLGATEQGLERAEARESIDFVIQLLDSQFRRARIRIEKRLPEGRIALAMPRRELIQVLLNLMINARDAMAQGGMLHVTCEVAEGRGVVKIADTGAGIPPDVLGRIFTPFFTTKGAKGTGLGLSVAESLVRSSGGSIDVESALGRGTVFTVRVPLAQEK